MKRHQINQHKAGHRRNKVGEGDSAALNAADIAEAHDIKTPELQSSKKSAVLPTTRKTAAALPKSSGISEAWNCSCSRSPSLCVSLCGSGR